MPRGFIPPAKVEEKEYKLGSLGGPVLQPNGHGWEQFLPPAENQDLNAIDPCDCVSFGSSHQTSTMMNRLFGVKDTYSERFLAIGSHTRPPGVDPQTVYEFERKSGFIPDASLPFSPDINTLEKYYSPDPLTPDLLAQGQNWLSQYSFQHQWVASGSTVDPLVLANELQYGVLAGAVYAWAFDDEKQLYVRPPGAQDCHWVTIFDYEPNVCFYIFDSYENNIKKLDWLFGFSYVKRVLIAKVDNSLTPAKKNAILAWLAAAAQWCYQVIVALKSNPDAPVVPSVPPPPDSIPPEIPSMIPVSNFAAAIQDYEGYVPSSRSYRNCNPGNLRFTELTSQLGATGKDADGFCIFPTYQVGLAALCKFIVLAKSDKLKEYHNCTIKSFFQAYAPSGDRNDPLAYAAYVALKIGAKVDDMLKNILV